jgi:hypothetical protein
LRSCGFPAITKMSTLPMLNRTLRG